MFALSEPQWGVDLLLTLHTRMQASDFLTVWMPIIADIFVFVYPVYLLCLYLYGVWYKNTFYKESALYILLAAFVTVCVNILIQSVVMKQRPDMVLGMVDSSRDALLLNHYLPASTFPSDHAGVSMAIAMASLTWGIRHKKKSYILGGIILLLISLVMSFARIAIAVHRPTDIVAGLLCGTIVAWILLATPVWHRIKKWIIHPLMQLQVWLWKLIGLDN